MMGLTRGILGIHSNLLQKGRNVSFVNIIFFQYLDQTEGQN